MREINLRDRTKERLIKIIFWSLAIVIGLTQAWANRYKFFSGDIIAYLDIGEAYFRGDWRATIHGVFSPLYPWILKTVMLVVKPSMYWEIFTIKLTNFLLMLLNLLCFEVFLNQFIVYYQQKFTQTLSNQYYVIPRWLWLILGYLLFIWSELYWITVYQDTPDILVASSVYLATAILLSLDPRASQGWKFIVLGIILGLGYLAKAFMFPLSIIFLILTFLAVRKYSKVYLKMAIACLCFLVVTVPLISSLSLQKGYFTFGETGKLNYAWAFNGVTSRYWKGEPPENGTPKHTANQLFSDPDVYEFSGHFDHATLPIGYDTSYWFEGLKVHLNLGGMFKVAIKNLGFYWQNFGIILLFGFSILLCVSNRLRVTWQNLRDNWKLLLPAIAGLGLYSLVIDLPLAHAGSSYSMRYVAPFVVILFAGCLSSVPLPKTPEIKRLMVGLTLGTSILVAGQLPALLQHPEEPIYWKVAQGLYQLGIGSRDRVAVISLHRTKDYWARLARFTIIAEIPNDQDFWQSTPQQRQEIYQQIKKTGAKAIVYKVEEANGTNEFMRINGWQKIGETQYYIYRLNL